MMNRSGAGTVVVGIDGSAAARAALRYAASAAQQHGWRLQVVHAYDRPLTAVALTDAFGTASRKAAEDTVAAAVLASTIPSGVTVTRVVEVGHPVCLLRRLGESANLVVLGRPRSRLPGQLLAGSVAVRVAAGMACPVAVVPADQSPPRQHSGRIVVALDGETSVAAALELAFAEAEARRSTLLVLHVNGREGVTLATGKQVLLESIVARPRPAHPGVGVGRLSVIGDTVDEIVVQSRDADLLVVGRPHRSASTSWLLSVARAVIGRADCPLLIAPAEPES